MQNNIFFSVATMEGSPVWKKPSEVMKIHRRRKSLSQRKVTATEEHRTDFIYKSPSKSGKRRNPFTSSDNSANKRQNTRKEKLYKDDNMCTLFNILDSAEVRFYIYTDPYLQIRWGSEIIFFSTKTCCCTH